MSEIAKWGFGMAPIKSTTNTMNRRALSNVINFVSGVNIANYSTLLDDISRVKGLFNRIIKQNQWDWFTVNMYFDYPSERDLRVIVVNLGMLRNAVVERDDVAGQKSLQRLTSSNITLYCNNYLNFDINKETTEQYIYILSRREEKEILKIGMTTRNIQKRVNEINSATGVLFPFSARKIYKVKDCRRAERDIHTLLQNYRIRSDREFFALEFRMACAMIEEYLEISHQSYYDPTILGSSV